MQKYFLQKIYFLVRVNSKMVFKTHLLVEMYFFFFGHMKSKSLVLNILQLLETRHQVQANMQVCRLLGNLT